MSESNYLTTGDLALLESRDSKKDRVGTTALGLGVGLGGAALVAALVIGWGVNQASKARLETANAMYNCNSRSIDILATDALQAKTQAANFSLEVNQTLRNLTGATANATGGAATSLSEAYALAQMQNQNGLGSAIGGCNFLRVANYQDAMPCKCNTCNC